MSVNHSAYADIFRGGEAFHHPLEEGAVHLFHQGKLFLFDPIAGNQCHLMANRVARLYQQRQVDRELLCSSLLVNSSFNREKQHIPAVAGVLDEKGCRRFMDQNDACQTARRVVIRNICSYLTTEIASVSDELLLDDVCGGSDGIVDKEEGPYPKFAGVKLLLRQLNANPVPVVLKIKVLTESSHYIATFVVDHPDETLKEATSADADRLCGQAVLAIEGLAACDHPVQTYMDSRVRCFHTLIQQSGVKRHAVSDACRHCCQGDEERRAEAIEAACGPLKTLRFRELIAAAGAAFTRVVQPEGHKKLMGSVLRNDYERALHFAEDHLISIPDKPSICMVEHVYADLGERALSNRRLVDTTPKEVREEILQGRKR